MAPGNRRRLVLCAIWFLSFFAAWAVLKLYSLPIWPDEKTLSRPNVYIESEDFMSCLKYACEFYCPYIAGILVFWFKPLGLMDFLERCLSSCPKLSSLFRKIFEPSGSARWPKVRFWLAVGCTVAFNFIFLIQVCTHLLDRSSYVLGDVEQGVTICAWMSFLVGPVQAFYFGAKKQPHTSVHSGPSPCLARPRSHP